MLHFIARMKITSTWKPRHSETSQSYSSSGKFNNILYSTLLENDSTDFPNRFSTTETIYIKLFKQPKSDHYLMDRHRIQHMLDALVNHRTDS